jgi:ABC-2 type transport system permease protein
VRRLRKLAWIEFKLLVREPITLVFALAYPLIVLFVLAEVFGTEITRDDETGELVFRGVSPVDYYVGAYVALVVASIGMISLPVHLASYRERGVLRRFRASGVPGPLLLGAQATVAMAGAAVSALVLFVAAWLVYDTALPNSALDTAVAFALVAVEFAAIGTLLGTALPTARAAQGAGLLLFFVNMFIAGAGPPPEVLSDVLRRTADFLPLTHAIHLLQDAWLGFGWSGTALIGVLGFTAGAGLLTLVFVRFQGLE